MDEQKLKNQIESVCLLKKGHGGIHEFKDMSGQVWIDGKRVFGSLLDVVAQEGGIVCRPDNRVLIVGNDGDEKKISDPRGIIFISKDRVKNGKDIEKLLSDIEGRI